MFIGRVTKPPQRFSPIYVIITSSKYQMRDSIFTPRFQVGMYHTRWKRPYIFGRIPHFDSTNYLTLISRSFSTIIKYQTFSVVWVERNLYFGRPAPWLLWIFCARAISQLGDRTHPPDHANLLLKILFELDIPTVT